MKLIDFDCYLLPCWIPQKCPIAHCLLDDPGLGATRGTKVVFLVLGLFATLVLEIWPSTIDCKPTTSQVVVQKDTVAPRVPRGGFGLGLFSHL